MWWLGVVWVESFAWYGWCFGVSIGFGLGCVGCSGVFFFLWFVLVWGVLTVLWELPILIALYSIMSGASEARQLSEVRFRAL